jgi:hypothetical protein
MKGYIYCIKPLNQNENNNIYIGCTKQPINIRYCKHRYDSKHQHRIKPVHKIILETGGFDNYYIKILKEFDNLNSLVELREYEKKIINDYRNNTNYTLMNKN